MRCVDISQGLRYTHIATHSCLYLEFSLPHLYLGTNFSFAELDDDDDDDLRKRQKYIKELEKVGPEREKVM